MKIEINKNIDANKEIKYKNDEQYYQESLRKYYKSRNELLQLTPGTRAKKTAWKLFRILYFSLKGEFPEEDKKQEVEKIAEEFFNANSEWSKPSLLCFKDYIGEIRPEINQNRNFSDMKIEIRKGEMRLLENGELSELKDIISNRKYFEQYGKIF